MRMDVATLSAILDQGERPTHQHIVNVIMNAAMHILDEERPPTREHLSGVTDAVMTLENSMYQIPGNDLDQKEGAD